jgi:Ribonuclease G/E
MKRRAVIEEGVGETRAAIYEGRKLVELHLDRWSDFHKPRIGEVWTGQVNAIDPSIGGLWLDLGKGPDGLLSFKGQANLPRLTEGALIDVRIAKEAMGEKGPVLKYEGDPTRDKAGSVELLDLRQRLSLRFPTITFEEAPVSIIDTATERRVAVPHGGTLTIDRTEALIAIDIDKGSAKTVMDCSEQAARLIMSQLRLRGLGGLIIIDFPNLRQPKQRARIIKIMEEMAEYDPASVRIAPFSRFGVVEMTRGVDGPSLDTLMNDRFGRPTTETQALQALRQLHREAKQSPGGQMTLTLPETLYHWLQEASFDWQAALTERIGGRFTVQQGDQLDIRSDR